MLIHAHSMHGNKWAELTKYLPGRLVFICFSWFVSLCNGRHWGWYLFPSLISVCVSLYGRGWGSYFSFLVLGGECVLFLCPICVCVIVLCMVLSNFNLTNY